MFHVKGFNFASTKHLKQAVCKHILGEGGFAVVKMYQCRNVDCKKDDGESCNECFVVKQVRPLHRRFWTAKEEKVAKEKAILNILQNEFRFGSELDHLNIIKILDIDIENKSLLMENFTGIDMLDYLNTDHVDVRMLLRYFSQILGAIKYLHEKGIAHMDIKLENILMDLENDKVKLIDMGHSKMFREGDYALVCSEVCGTECYFPPELFTINEYRADKVDIWCCGIVLYNILYDKMPWEQANTYKDNNYRYNKKYFDLDKLCPLTFPDITRIKMNPADQTCIKQIFIKMFQTLPCERFTAHELETSFLQLRDVYEEKDMIITNRDNLPIESTGNINKIDRT